MIPGTTDTATTHTRVNDRMEVSNALYDLVVKDVLPGLGLEPDWFWSNVEAVIAELTPKNNVLLLKRYQMQAAIDTWHQSRCDAPHDHAKYMKFLRKLGYLQQEGPDFAVSPTHIDAEIASIAGPQLVVPVKNARYALNASNARWGSLYDALYGSDVIPEADGAQRGGAYNPVRGAKVIAYARAFLDRSAPLASGSHAHAMSYTVIDGRLEVTLGNGEKVGLAEPAKFAGYNGAPAAPHEVLLKNNGLHIVIQIDAAHPVGKGDAAHIKDLVIESAVTTIQDCEDSVAAADGPDKAEVYRNWLGLMKGTLTDTFEKGGRMLTRTLAPDLTFTAPDGGTVTLHGRALLLVRNVGHLMTNEAVLLSTARKCRKAFSTAS